MVAVVFYMKEDEALINEAKDILHVKNKYRLIISPIKYSGFFIEKIRIICRYCITQIDKSNAEKA